MTIRSAGRARDHETLIPPRNVAVCDDPVHIACSSDARYLPHLATLVESIAASNRPETIHLHLLLDESVSATQRDEFRRACNRRCVAVEFICPEQSRIAALPVTPAYPPVIWYRILLPDLLGSLARILYLDADTLVLQDLSALWRTDLGMSLVAAVAHPAVKDTYDRIACLGLPPTGGYFNSGVLLMNLEGMRAEQFSSWMTDVATRRAPDLAYPDQDALNLVCTGRWLRLHPRWNCFAWLFHAEGEDRSLIHSDLALSEAVASPAILHFEGTKLAKPWSYRSRHPLRGLYRAYRQRTPWPLVTLEDTSIKSKLLNLLPVRQQLMLARLKSIVSRRVS